MENDSSEMDPREGCRIAADARETCIAQIADRACDHQRMAGSSYCACHPLPAIEEDDPVADGHS